jgi:uncharacterized membrane protein YgcG
MMKKNIAPMGFCLVLTVFLSVLISVFSSARASERILSFHSDITVHHNASMTVRETIRVRSEGQEIRRGIYRDFPTSYKDIFGNRYIVGFTVIDVFRDNTSEPYHINNISNGKRVYIGDKDILLPRGEYTYALVYKITRQLGFFKDYDELYWNVTGNGWVFPIERASASVVLPGEASRHIISTDAYTGPYGSTGKDFEVSFDPSGTVMFSTTRPLDSHEGLTIVVSWPKGFVVRPDAYARLNYFLSDNRGVLTGAFGLICILIYYLLVWIRAGRDPSRGVIVTRYTPPDKMSPAVMRYITKMRYDDRVFAAAVINMAVKGFLKIVEEFGEYTVKRTEGKGVPLSREEQRVMKKLLGSQKEITFETANYLKIQAAIKALRNYLSLTYEKIYFVTNRKYFIAGLILTIGMLLLSGFWDALGKGTLPVFLFICIWLSGWSIGVFALLSMVVAKWKGSMRTGQNRALGTGGALFITLFSIPFVIGEFAGIFILGYATSVTMVVLLLLSIFINYLFYNLLKAPTRAGRRVLDTIEGFRTFLVATEKDRLNMLNTPEKTPELFEKYLPYALALDVEQTWSEQFADILSSAATGLTETGYAPAWYSGVALSSMTAGDFASSLGDSFSGAISSSSTAPGSSSGSGGGGSSGGGGGGGGGGGW